MPANLIMKAESFSIAKWIYLSIVAHGLLFSAFGGIEYTPAQIYFSHSKSGIKLSLVEAVSNTPRQIKTEKQTAKKAQPKKNSLSNKQVATRYHRTQSTEQQHSILRPDKQLKKVVKSAPTSNTAPSSGMGESKLYKAALINSPKPPYPYRARRAGFEGKVVLNIKVNRLGQVRTAQILKSSGRADCDNSAKNTILERWRFKPATLFGNPIPSNTKIAVIFKLTNHS